MKIQVNLNNIKKWIIKHIWFYFWVALLVLLIFEGFVLKRSYNVIMQIRDRQEFAPLPHNSRINFTEFSQAQDRIKQAQQYKPQAPIGQNPFSSPNKEPESH